MSLLTKISFVFLVVTFNACKSKSEQLVPEAVTLPKSILFWGDVNYPGEVVKMEFTWQKNELVKVKETFGSTSWIDVYETNPATIVRYKGRDENGTIVNSRPTEVSADKKEITLKGFTTYVYQYDQKNRLVKAKDINQQRVDILNLVWNESDQVTSIEDTKNKHTIATWSGPNNPLWEITKQTNFFGVFNPGTYFYYLGKQIPDEWKTKNIKSTIESITKVTKTLDANGRIIKLVALTDGKKTQEITIEY